ncbi:hypothetical protein JKG68_02840 [Microvirga aerilata]|uniref:Uncharacterized protein n=1 Tax=Microvirga aerilata TaxID=670292 RepID=A0A936Z6C1_9HYPH|nr:hypothetical protein [Microvirga aerilata]MBL0402896.1 hypothetical protein [Microvirga aerilata]
MATRKRRNAPLWAFACFVFPVALGFLFMTQDAIADSREFKKFDQQWPNLVLYDPDIKDAVNRLSGLGDEALDKFKRAYAGVQQKSSIQLIVSEIEQQWTQRKELGLKLFEKYKGVEILVDPAGSYHVAGRTTQDIGNARVIATGAARRR